MVSLIARRLYRALGALVDLPSAGVPHRRSHRDRRPTKPRFGHPGLAAALRRDRRWRQISAVLYGESRSKCIRTMRESNRRKLELNPNAITINGAGYGGQFRAVQGFRCVGEEGLRNE